MFVSVIIQIAKDEGFFYNTDLDLKIGDIVYVPFRNKEVIGVIDKINIDTDIKLKDVFRKSELPPIKPELIDLIKWVSKYYFIPLGMVLKMVIIAIKYTKKEKTFIQNIKSFTLNILSPEQEKAKKFIQYKNDFNVVLLEGTTGSGKTEVYFHLIADLLQEQDKQILILLPEIALTTQLISRFKKQFNFEPAIWHSDITKGEKSKIFYGVINGNTKLVIGTRSALFLPFKNLQLIIVDEEHDSSYKQTENGCYNGRNVAIKRAQLNNIPIVLASATPSIETLINVDNSKCERVFLKSRYGNAVLPEIKIVDLRQEKLKQNQFLSTPLKKAITENLINKRQTMLFMNRRGYAPIVLCAECGEKIQCPNCHCNMTYYKSSDKIMCNYCGYFLKKSELKKCPSCESEKLIEFGPGVEKIEKEVQEHFPTARSMVLSSDTINTTKKLTEMIEQILNNEVDIIIGTQLIAKGHHFPNLTLVGVCDSDASLFGGDFRATEKTYQLLTQVSGRAGREEEKGVVYLQSYTPENLILQAFKNNDKETLLNYEKQNRQLGNFPPYSNIAIIGIISNIIEDSFNVAKEIITKFNQIREIEKYLINGEIEVLGPVSVIHPYKHRYNIFVKCSKNIKQDLQKIIRSVIEWWEMDEKEKNGSIKTAEIRVEID
ncbi:MAG: primosomal protein N' [Rickettsiales bacterium]|nr:MAG: primosomal protein N' [Rickettsiales bacterium]